MSLANQSYRGSALAIYLVCFFSMLFIYRETVLSIIPFWLGVDSDLYNHGFLVLGAGIYLAWYRRGLLARFEAKTSLLGLMILAVVVLFWLLGEIAKVQIVAQLGIVGLAAALSWTLFGFAVFRVLLVSFALILLALPLWDPLVPVLQNATAIVATQAVKWAGIPVYLEAHFISIPAGTFHVDETCGGLRYFIASLTLGVIFSFLNYSRWQKQLSFVLVCLLMALVANWARVITVVIAGHLTEMTHPWVTDHINLGWWIFGASIIPVFWLGSLWRDQPDAADVQSQSESTVGNRQGVVALLGMALVSLLVLASGSQAAIWFDAREPGRLIADLEFPIVQDGWHGPVDSRDGWRPVFHGADLNVRQSYHSRAGVVETGIAYYRQQKQGAELISAINSVAGELPWRRVDELGVFQLADPTVIDAVQETLISDGHRKRLVWQWYVIGGQATANRYVAKYLEVRGLLMQQPGAFAVTMATNYKGSPSDAREQLAALLGEMGQDLVTRLQ